MSSPPAKPTLSAPGSSPPPTLNNSNSNTAPTTEKPATTSPSTASLALPTHNLPFTSSKPWFTVRSTGESGRTGFSPKRFSKIILRSSNPASRAVNVLWPVVPVAIAIRYALPEQKLAIFVLHYLAMVPCANLLGFTGQELARKVPHVVGVLTETTLGSLVEIIMFLVLILRKDNGVDYLHIIKAAILGSILATMLLCLGLCFVVGGLRRSESTFSAAVSEAGSGLLLTAGFGLAIPTVFSHSLGDRLTAEALKSKALDISRSTAILLIVAYLVYVFFQARTHHGIYNDIFIEEELRDTDRHEELKLHRLTFTEVIVALVLSIGLVTLIAINLVDKIHFLVEERHVSDAFVGLIMLPLVEKAAEHLTAVDEAWDDQMNFALSHVLGATLQTALFNGPFVVIVGWGLGKDMGLNFEVFDLAVLLLAILTVGNFLRDQKSNYLEGVLCVIVYVAIAVAALYYPNPEHGGSDHGGPSAPVDAPH
ncbi:hypothetical protein QBC34DRAFT_63721 [Podospora aff. communis PSN243]|uniref:Vacuolar calcium ion transporter n=1 Tax=Podospora aff. communis PSN243 TaxID=3040156 RepID=A0AAV9GTC0_9PEZI|nr:hypothetical protein QBC34DRAFT_63721 [Podospora aff. communis PSN243]